MQAELLIHITVSLSSSMSGDTGQPSLKVDATIGSDLEVHVLPRTYVTIRTYRPIFIYFSVY